jgi:hypothetical protein
MSLMKGLSEKKSENLGMVLRFIFYGIGAIDITGEVRTGSSLLLMSTLTQISMRHWDITERCWC